MLKKINQYLLFNHPLLWNIKIAQVLIFALICHSFFFLIGYNSVAGLSVFKDWEYSGLEHFQIFLLGGLLLILGLIIWLIYYLRHNAFKSFYPVTKSRLRKEFFLVFFIFILNLPIFHTYLYARHLKLLKISAHLNPEEDAKIVNLAAAFIPTSSNKYDSQNCCDSFEARAERDKKMPQAPIDYCDAGSSEPISTQDASMAASEATAAPSSSYSEYLYGNYFEKAIQQVEFKNDAYDYHYIVKRWLKNKERDSIKTCLQAYFKTMDKYHARYKVDIDTLVAWCFLDEKNTVYHEVTSSYGGLKEFEFAQLNYMEGEFEALNYSINHVHNLRTDGFFSAQQTSIYLYIAFGLSLLLILFRFTRLKPWISAIIGTGVWAVIFGLMTFAFEEDIQYVFILFIVLCLFLSVRFIRSKHNKLFSALWLHWFSFGFLGLFPLVMYNIYSATGDINKCINHLWVNVRPAYPIHDWINYNWDTIGLINWGIGMLVALFVIIPLCHRWQANPSE
jgi:hypothetical protein